MPSGASSAPRGALDFCAPTKVGAQHRRNTHAMIPGLVVLDQRRQQARRGDGGVVERMGELDPTVLVAVPDAGPPRLPIVQGGTAVRLAETLKRRHPRIYVIHAELPETHVAGAAFDHLVMESERLEDFLGASEQGGVPVRRRVGVGLTDDELFDLLELVNPEQAPDVSTRAPGLSTKARGYARVSKRQIGVGDNLAGVYSDEADVTRAREEQVVVGQLIGFLAAALST